MAKKEYNVYSLTEVIEILGVTRRTLYNWIKDGKIKAIKAGQQWRITQEALEEFLNKGTDPEKE